MVRPNIKLVILASCIAAFVPHNPSAALLLGNFIGCNSFGCRISALESDVAQLKQQVARLTDPQGMQGMQGIQGIQGMQGMQGMNNFRPSQMLPFNQNGLNQVNQQGQQGQQSQLGQQGQQGQQGLNNQQQGVNQAQATDGGQRVNYALDYSGMNQNLRRAPGYQNTLNNGQFIGA